jgi:hypothetical protein
MSEKLFKFTVTNERTHETASFMGQGSTIMDAMKDGLKNIGSKSRKDIVNSLSILTSSGVVNRTVEEFEGDQPAIIEEL